MGEPASDTRHPAPYSLLPTPYSLRPTPDTLIRRLLIANRGEIAVRIIRACREMGIAAIAVCSEEDINSLHVRMADESYCIGGAQASESYLSIEKIIDAAKKSGADAIHPGYGFLSENADFAVACSAAGIKFVGPPPSVIRALGDKSAAKNRMAAAGVPVVPGYHGEEQTLERLEQEASKIECPLLIKASAGGGGRGMRVVREMDSFAALLAEAKREARASFGRDRVLLERYLDRPRHVEIQIFGDEQGNIIALPERECSIQRRHQKIIEESPSPFLNPELRSAMQVAAATAGNESGYVNAGTVEFLVEERADSAHKFYFLEMNTRLQVEHPVTELRTGIDHVLLQIGIAEGRPLPLAQSEIHSSGHVIEARICAEDASAGFLPSTGEIHCWNEPTGPGIRVDSGVTSGSIVSPYYDPMLAKLIVQGDDRAHAIARLEQALCQFQVLGIQTNIPYLLAIVRHPSFRSGATHTGFLAEHLPDWQPNRDIPNEILVALAAETLTLPAAKSSRGQTSAANTSLWDRAGNWRNV